MKLTRRSLLSGAGGAALSPAILKAAPLGSKSHIAVIGAGVFGAWTAHHLQQLGHRVTLLDAHGPAHSRASSGGESRMTRAAYGKDDIYTRMSTDSLPQWKALSGASGLPIFVPHGVLFFFPTDEPYAHDSIAAHRRLGLPSQLLTPAEMARRFPMIDFAGIRMGLFEPGFGALMARRSVQTLVRQFVRSGGDYRHEAAHGPRQSGGKLRSIRLSSGSLEADAFVFALGPWLPKIFPDVVGGRIQPTRQEVFFFAPPAGDRRFLPGAMPGWADFNGGDIYYGFPDLESRGVKFAHDAHGAAVDPDAQDRRHSEAALADVVAFRDRRFPLLRNAPLTEARVCQYENSSNGDFLIDLHPRLSNVLLVGGGSGHGFKHGPEVGRYAAARLFDRVPAEPRFSLATKAETHKREVH
ncbi:FAD-dependent oxidoreductase [Sphingomonas sp.]|uniref:FAD-dependent oxidoreductase n=1 Tax=Sphingomonas sp. TaxID=28214 RepID=UPI001846F991|nr:FAD-dependent oxidoreductase [Sphingomonas sp.]MBA3510974.1 FAD-dependent oxidoreductase [Sphingomonas sp.]